MTPTKLKIGEYKDFVARLEDGKYLTVTHYQHDEDPGRGQEDARRMLSHFKLIWGLESDPTQDGHSGGHASAVCRPVTAEYLHNWLPNVSGKLDSAIESAAEEWAHNLENERPEGALNWGGHIIIYYSVIGSNKVRERMLTDDELMQFWAWCIGTEQFSHL